jgi:hypothetical protein
MMMNFLGIFNFNAPYMPWVLLGFSYLISGSVPISDILGIIAGHVYYYFEDVYPQLYGGSRPLSTPEWMKILINPRVREVDYHAVPTRMPMERDPNANDIHREEDLSAHSETAASAVHSAEREAEDSSSADESDSNHED